jgi:methylmalonyl-CoA mutase
MFTWSARLPWPPGTRPWCRSSIEELKKLDGGEILVVAGGVIPPGDYQFLYDAGVSGVFGPGTPITESAAKVLNELGA